MAADKFLTIPYPIEGRELIRIAAGRSGRSIAGYIKHATNLEMQRQGLVDADFKPVPEVAALVQGMVDRLLEEEEFNRVNAPV